ncbi:unnamed protein product [Caenorhabditis angaria]|uniref:Serpentine receptor class r-10 n=1 Tax=Caenorhabditis angaria TaxID=860376 RepID=A0A9P1N6K2_9PELO|nr:unnamed protein product [Caenorhabditis angaria]
MSLPYYYRLSEYVAFVGAVLMNSSLLYLLVTKAGASFGRYRIFMITFCLYTMVYSFIVVLAQPVIHIEGPSIIFILGGYFKFNKTYGYFLCGLYCGSFAFCTATFATHFIYRYINVCRFHLLQIFDGWKLWLWYIPPIILMYIWGAVNVYVFEINDFKKNYFRKIMNETYEENVDEVVFVAPIYFLVDKQGNRIWQFKDLGGILILCCILSFTINVCLVCAYMTYRNLNRLSKMSSKSSAELNKQLFTALALQTLLPCLTQYIPCSLLYICPFIGVNAGKFANTLGLYCSIYTVLDPLIAMLIIERFRKFIFCKYSKVNSKGTLSTEIRIKKNTTNSIVPESKIEILHI